MRRSDFAHLEPLVLEGEDGEEEEVPNYPAIARAYAEAAADGGISVCRWIRLAAERYLDMLEMAEENGNEFYYSPVHVVDYCRFVESFVHPESGRWEVTQVNPDGSVDPWLILEPHQIWVESAIHGFRKKLTGERLVSRSLEILPRKSAKTLLLAIAALFDLCCSGQLAPSVPLASTSVKQSDDTIYGVLRKLLTRNPDLVEQFALDLTTEEIRLGDGKIFKLSSRGEKQDGLNPSLAIFEEGHAGAESVYKVVRSAFGARPNALLRMITTAGYRAEGPAYDLLLEAQRILEGKSENYSFFAAIYTLDKADYIHEESGAIDWLRLLKDEKLISKSNPMYRVSLDPDLIKSAMQEAIDNPVMRGEVARTRFNIWTGSGASLVDPEQWLACIDDVRMEQFFDQRCWLGVDLASYNDMCAIGAVFERGPDLVVFAKYFIPEGSPLITDPDMHDTVAYWAEQDWITITEGPEADYDRIEIEINTYCQLFDMQGIGFDPYQSNQISKRVAGKGVPVFRYPNTASYMTTPTDDILGRITGKRLRHDGNGVLTWNAGNVHGDKRDNGSIMPRKEKKGSKRKVDGFIAVVIANGLRMEVEVKQDEQPRQSAYANPDRIIGL